MSNERRFRRCVESDQESSCWFFLPVRSVCLCALAGNFLTYRDEVWCCLFFFSSCALFGFGAFYSKLPYRELCCFFSAALCAFLEASFLIGGALVPDGSYQRNKQSNVSHKKRRHGWPLGPAGCILLDQSTNSITWHFWRTLQGVERLHHLLPVGFLLQQYEKSNTNMHLKRPHVNWNHRPFVKYNIISV
jgi:hypothetical protein